MGEVRKELVLLLGISMVQWLLGSQFRSKLCIIEEIKSLKANTYLTKKK